MLKPSETVLVVVDVQGKLARLMYNSEAMHQQLITLISGARIFDIPILWLEQLPDKLGPTSEELRLVLEGFSPIPKEHFSGWACDEFQQALNNTGRKQVLLCGIETHICVYQSCRDMLDNGFDVHLVADAMGSRTAENKALGLQMMGEAGAKLTNVESLLFELQHHAVGDSFRALLKLIK
ncbi:hydrolase [Shewanella amazonensis]|uniref:Isochorismatase family protein n=1 Tax=Shewanella amazonensis (strain ATCC BAA-1098 / SB2B) TaxID=326297 RepID=A1S3A1_SHEAM|nr:hydrolase [Shewanella amazonensis]ABL98857.1 isochorismatase family protein [Shewanella amazonensis SB2B]